ncbi:histidine--tRNA ligase [Clostridia bacterium]|nr:histidine--tRNA ligase [Clostridia bacterium]
MAITRPKGTNDIMPDEMKLWHYMENIMREICQTYGYHEIRTPMFENTELFQRGVGETSDIVEKEMYTFQDKGKRSITLRPEGTASVVRAFVENRDYAEAQPTKYYYQGPMFRYSRPQAGRYRQFNQFGVEALGSKDPAIDAEVITLCMEFFERLGLKQLELHINSVGCKKCRPVHKQALKDYLTPHFDELCDTCKKRFDTNPLRIFDCKSDTCQAIVKNAPTITSCLCEECEDHLAELKSLLDASKIQYILDENLVRGLDYYTKTAFEIMVSDIGAQSSIGGGGRYDSLVEEVGGPDMPGIGFAVGLERTLLSMKAQEVPILDDLSQSVFIAAVSIAEKVPAYQLMQALRKEGIAAEMEVMGRSLKAQFKYANKQGFSHVVTVGDEEVKNMIYPLKDMKKKEERRLGVEEMIHTLKEEA